MGRNFTIILVLIINILLKAQSTELYKMGLEPSINHEVIQNNLLRSNKHSFNNVEKENVTKYSKKTEEGSNWNSNFTVPGVILGPIYSMTTDGKNIYIGGTFSIVDNIVANNVAMWDGEKWHSIGSGDENGVDFTVNKMVYINNKLFVGGSFGKAGSRQANGIAYWDGSQWNTLGSGETNGVRKIDVFTNGDTLITSGFVAGLSIYKDYVVIGGHFHLAGETRASGIAGWNINSGQWENFQGGLGMISTDDPYTNAFAFAVDDNNLYIGGKFETAGNTNANMIAMWDGNQWHDVGGGANLWIRDLEFDSHGNLYAAGFFKNIGNVKASGIAMWDGNNWHALGNDLFVESEDYNPSLQNVCILNDNIYVGGSFSNVGSKQASGFAMWNGNEWIIPTDKIGYSGTRFPGGIFSMQKLDSKIYIGGYFDKVEDIYSRSLIVWEENTSSWNNVSSSNQAKGILDGSIYSITISDGKIYAGGSFSNAGGVLANSIAVWNGSNWESLGIDYDNGVNGSVYSILVDGNDVFIGGQFSFAGSTQAYHIAKWNGKSWSPLGIGVGGVQSAGIYALAKIGDYIYAGGHFAIVGDLYNGNTPANSIARFNIKTDRWEALDEGVQLFDGYPGIINTFDYDGNILYIGGKFDLVKNFTAHNIAKFENEKWDFIGNPESNGLDGTVNAIKTLNKEIYIGGVFQVPGNNNLKSFVKWDGFTWKEIQGGISYKDGTPLIRSIEVNNNRLVVAGIFDRVGEKAVSNIALLNGNEWDDLNGGFDNTAVTLGISGNSIYAGGWFTTAGGIPSVSIAQYELLPTHVKENVKDIPKSFVVEQNFPNPFNPNTAIHFEIPTQSFVIVKIYNTVGEEVATIFNGIKNSGKHALGWNGSNFSSGVYLCRFEVTPASSTQSTFSKTIKLILLK